MKTLWVSSSKEAAITLRSSQERTSEKQGFRIPCDRVSSAHVPLDRT